MWKEQIVWNHIDIQFYATNNIEGQTEDILWIEYNPIALPFKKSSAFNDTYGTEWKTYIQTDCITRGNWNKFAEKLTGTHQIVQTAS